MKRWKLLLALLLAVGMVFAGRHLCLLKTEVMSDTYSEIIFTRLAVEAQTYTREIEYGLQNGKSLDRFYGVENILGEVRRGYSYTNGVYILSAECKLLYESADEEVATPTRIREIPEGSDAVYAVYNDARRDRYLISVPIRGRGETPDGYMVLSVDRMAIENTMEDSRRENIIQTAVTATLVYLCGVILLIHTCRDRQKLLGGACRTAAVSLCGYILLDGGLSAYKLLVRIESIIQQSVSGIVMAMQVDLDAVGEKGVAFNKIYDLNDWLLDSSSQVPYIDTLIYDKNYRISAVISEDYIITQAASYAVRMGLALLTFTALGVVLTLLGAGMDRLIAFAKRKRKERHDGIVPNRPRRRRRA